MKSFLFTVAFVSFVFICQAQQVPDTTGSDVSREDAQKALDLHNKYRADVGTPALKWSPVLAAVAQSWANKLAADNCGFKHSQGNQYGENLFGGSGTKFKVMDATNSWYNEIRQFDIKSSNNDLSETGHYTQMVWRTTTHVGMGVSICSNGNYIIVANYDPPGNVIGDKPY